MNESILVEHVSKKYSRNADGHLNYGLQDLWRTMLGKKSSSSLRADEFYAVNDISLSVAKGETIALIGRNGSGKTTLLKMLHGLTRPDVGRIAIRGRVQALINLGAGFNGSLSGMDNIMNAAAIMGLSRRETLGLRDEIISFAELEEFIDSPVGTYSSGMKARLGFAVAVHMRPDILLIDEVLAVGDFAFQNKCFTRLEELKSAGVTIVFVSHNHNQVVKLCERAIWIHKGTVHHDGTSLESVQHYLNFLDDADVAKSAQEREKRKAVTPALAPQTPAKAKEKSADVKENGKARDGLYGPVYPEFDHVENVVCTLKVDGEETSVVPIHSRVDIHFSFKLKHRVNELCSTLAFHRKDGMRVAAIATLRDGRLKHIHEGHVHCELTIPDLDFIPGPYIIMMPISDGHQYLWRNVVCEFNVVGKGEIYVGVKDIKHEYRVYTT